MNNSTNRDLEETYIFICKKETSQRLLVYGACGMENKIIIAETERLILRRYKKEDIQDLFEYLSDEEVVKYEPYKPQT